MAGHPAVVWALRLAVLGLFVVTILAGLFGDPNPYRNIAPDPGVDHLVGGPRLRAGFRRRRLAPGQSLAHRLRCGRLAVPAPRRRQRAWLAAALPAGAGGLAGLPLLLAFCWIELVYPNAAVPAHIAWLAIAYSVLTWAGMLVFGRDAWLQHGEVFSLVFGTFARFAPTEARDGRLLLRPPGAGLLDDRPVSTSMMAFVLLLLATVLYDGLIGTGEWAELEERAAIPPAGIGRNQRHGDQDRRPRRLLGAVPRRLSRHHARS